MNKLPKIGNKANHHSINLFQSMRRKLLLLFLAISLVPLGCLGVFSYYQSQRAVEMSVHSELNRSAEQQASSLVSWLQDKVVTIEVMAGTEIAKSMQPQRINPYLQSALDQYKSYETLMVLDSSGIAIANTQAHMIGTSSADRPYYIEAIKGKTIVTDPTISRGTGNVVIMVGTPVKSTDGKILGVLAGVISTATINQAMASAQIGKGGEAYLVDSKGTMVTPSRFAESLKAKGLIKERAELELKVDTIGTREAIAGNTGVKEYQGYRGNTVLGAYRPVKIGNLQLGMLVEADKSEVLAIAADLRNATLIALLIAAIAIGFISYLAARQIAGPLITMSKVAVALGAGNVNQQITIKSRDEIGQLADAFREMLAYLRGMAEIARSMAKGDLTQEVQPKSSEDALGIAFRDMITNLRKLVGQVQISADQLADSSSQLGSGASQTGAAVQQVTSTIQHIAQGAQNQSRIAQETSESMLSLSKAISQVTNGTIEQARDVEQADSKASMMAKSVQKVASNASQLAQGSQETREAALRGSQMVQETIAGISPLKASVDRTAAQIDDLGQASEQIGAVVETIDDIAEQTNLLALNAAIEAARAGEHGRGFAVVADEVRKLAERSSKETRRIAELVRNVQVGAKAAVDAMHSGAKQAEAGTALAARAGDALNQIVQSVEQTVKQVNDIAEAAQQMALASQDVTNALDGISAVIQRAKTAAGEMESLAQGVSQAVETAASTAVENSAATEEVTAAAEEMSAQVEEMTAQAEQLAKMADQLRALVANFQIDVQTLKDENLEPHNGVDDVSGNIVPRRRAADWRTSLSASAAIPSPVR